MWRGKTKWTSGVRKWSENLERESEMAKVRDNVREDIKVEWESER